jgi:hypothetical protein
MQKYSILIRQASIIRRRGADCISNYRHSSRDSWESEDWGRKGEKQFWEFYFFSHLRNILNKKSKYLETGHLVYVDGGRRAENMLPAFSLRRNKKNLYKKLFKDSMAFEPRALTSRD